MSACIRSTFRGAFSLIEVTVALSVTSILLVTIGSALVLVSRAIPDGESGAAAAVEASDALTRLADELQHATYIAEHAPHAITFLVPDRTGDGSPERLRYAWSGDAGDPLTRQLNDADPIPVIDALDALELTYHQHETTTTYPGPPVVSSEQLLSERWSGIDGDATDAGVSASHWLGHYVEPSIDADAMWWQPTRLTFRARRLLLSSGSFRLQLRGADLADRPEPDILADETFDLSLLSLVTSTYNVTFSGSPRLTPGEPVAIAIGHPSSSSNVAAIEYYDNTDIGGMSIGDSNDNWSYEPTKTLRYRLHGHVATEGDPQQVTRRWFTSVELHLRTSAPATAIMDLEVELANRPERLQRYWKTDFRHDPTIIDVAGDQQSDWVASNGFDAATLNDGVWHVDRLLYARSPGPIATPLHAHLRLRHASADGGAAIAWFYVDADGSTVGNVATFVQRQSDGTQTAAVFTQHNDDTWTGLTSVTDLPAGFIDLRLLIDPAHGTVHVEIDGRDEGTHRYELRGSSSNSGAIVLGHAGSHARFQYVRIGVME